MIPPHSARDHQGVSALIVYGYRRIAAQSSSAPTAKTTDEKIVEIYSQVVTAFHKAAQLRGEHIPGPYLNTIVWHYLQLFETLGPQCQRFFEEHLQREVSRFLVDGLREDYRQKLSLFDENTSDTDAILWKHLQTPPIEALTANGVPEPEISERHPRCPMTNKPDDVYKAGVYDTVRGLFWFFFWTLLIPCIIGLLLFR